MPTYRVELDGVLREAWNDELTADATFTPSLPARSVRFWTAAGVVESTRAYTTAEGAQRDAINAATAASAVRRQLRADAQTAVTEITASVESLKVIYNKANNVIGPADTKDTAREARRIGRQTIRLSKILLELFDSSSAGTAE